MAVPTISAMIDKRFVDRHGCAIGPIGGQRVENIGGRYDPDFEGYLGLLKPAWITVAVELFVMASGNGGKILEGCDTRQDHFAERRMLLHRDPLVVVQFGGFVEDGVADPELADVVQQRGTLQPSPLLR